MKVLVLVSLAILLVCVEGDPKNRQKWRGYRRKEWRRLRPVGPPSTKMPKTDVDIGVKRGSLRKVPGVSGSLPKVVATKRNNKPKKSDHYIDPKVLEKLNKVTSIIDVIRLFNPKGYSLKKETVIVPEKKDPVFTIKGSKGASGRPNPQPVVTGAPGSGSEEKEVLVAYEGDNRLADSLQLSDSTGTSCKPREYLHSISEVGKTHIPSCVSLKRCAGCCTVARECVADVTANKTVLVYELSFATNTLRTISMSFVEHLTCKCGCIVKPTDCYAMQTYSSANCQCECKRDAVACAAGKHWSRTECNCICSNRRTCSSLFRKWDEASCACVCINIPCPAGTVQDKETCSCVQAAGDAMRDAAGFRMFPIPDGVFRDDTGGRYESADDEPTDFELDDL